ncbi:Rab family GTPase [Entamoeba histolytica HM-1:IMSS-B]|uniref:Rab family GTPase n=6 Tax=Entamoeba histolytica TaxID=5759 RepID=A0A8U0WPU9_ENTH1|eukprot:XP_657472.1 Rab family GTPase [Entamoeba histolytica HM-1:IMSS]
MSLFKRNGGFDQINKGVEIKKISIIGDVGVGKTAIVHQFTTYKFEEIYEPTIGANYSSKVVYDNNKYIRLQIWDCAGKEMYKSLVDSYLENSDIVILVFDDPFSFQHSKERLNKLGINSSYCQIIFVLNQIDKFLDKELSHKARQFTTKKGIPFFETSALQRKGIDELFNSILSGKYESLEHIPHSSKLQKRLCNEELVVLPKDSYGCSCLKVGFC